VGVKVPDPGDGYVVTPNIVFEDAYYVTTTLDRINFLNHTIQFLDITFSTGELVYLEGVSSNGYTIVPDGFYYIGVIQIETTFSITPNGIIVSLHTNYQDSIDGQNHIIFVNENTVPADYEQKMSIRARAIPSMVNNKIRSLKPTLCFDRTSYESRIKEWVPGAYYSSPYISIGNDASNPDKLYIGTPYDEMSGTVSPAGGSGATFTIYNILMGGNYEADIEFGGTGYDVNDLITILGTDLGGTTPANDCVIKVIDIDLGVITEIEIDTSSGTPLDVRLASLQGAVLPIVSVTSDDGNAVATVNYGYSALHPGQVNGSLMYFYRVHSAYPYDDSSSGGAIIEVYRPKFNPSDINNLYYIQVVDPGSIYTTGDTISIPGDPYLGGVTGINDCKIYIQANLDGSIFSTNVTGFSNGQFGQYYVKVISNTDLEIELGIYYDPKFINPVAYSNFIWTDNSTDYGYLPEPLVANYSYGYNISSIVYYSGYVWQCIDANNDTEFDPTKWIELSSDDGSLNALDRIEAYYAPTIDMPGKDAQQLVKGITYPNNVYYGNAFAPDEELPLDFIVRDEPFYPRQFNAKASVFDGTYIYVVGNNETTTLVLKFDSEGTFVSSSSIGSQVFEITSMSYSLLPTETYIITTTNTTNPLFTSFDGANWIGIGETTAYDTTQYGDGGFDSSSIDAPYASLYGAVIVNNNYFLTGKNILKSTDAFAYNSVYDPFTSFPTYINNMMYVNLSAFNGYIGVGLTYRLTSGGGTAYPIYSEVGKVVLSIDDGNTWTQLLPDFSSSKLNGVSASNTYIVVVGNDASVWYSTNASNWTEGTISGSSITTNIKSVAYGAGKFIAVGDKTGTSATDPGLILLSTDGITWSQISSSSITTNNLNQVYYGNNRFYVVGEENTLITSSDGINWYELGKLVANDPFYIVQGNDFLYGYGPEELVPGVIADNLSMYVTTAPGAYWDLNVSNPFWYKHTGFNMQAVVNNLDINYQVSFRDVVLNPARMSVFLLNNSTNLSTRIYEDTYGPALTYNYSVDWYNQTITFNNSAIPGVLPAGHSLLIELYEVGNGKEIVRGNSRNIPLLIDPVTGYSMYVFNTTYESIVNEPLVYVSENGGSLTKLTHNIDYFVTNTNDNFLKLLFNKTYDLSTDYIVYSILGDSSTSISVDQFGYSIPETQIFVAETTSVYFELDMSLTSLDGDNVLNSVVEKNGNRIAYIDGDINTDYIFEEIDDVWYLKLETAPTVGDVIAVTTFYDTSRQFLTTGRYISGTSLRVAAITYIDNTVSPIRVTFATDPNPSVTNISGSLFKLDGVNGTTEVNGNTYYINQIDSTNYDLYSFVVTTSVTGVLGDSFITTTDIDDIIIGMLVSGTGIGKGATNGGAFITNIEADTPTAGTYKITLSVVNTDVVSSANFAWKTTGDDFSTYISSGFGWDNLFTIQVPSPTIPANFTGMPPMIYTEGSRTWVTITGKRLNPSYVKFYDDNYIGILHPLTLVEEVLVTSMVTGASPNSISFNLSVDKNSQSYVTRTNSQDGSWLTQDFITGEDTMHFYNVSNLVEQVNTTVNVVEVDSVIYAYVQCDINTVKQVEVYNNTTLETLTDDSTYGIRLVNGRAAIVFISGANAGDLVTVSLIIGNIVEINGEKIKFNTININNNTITGLTRGVQGTTTLETHAENSIGFGITPARRLTEAQYSENWNSYEITSFGDPLQISTTSEGIFLNSIN
jgi:hypothetical protein